MSVDIHKPMLPIASLLYPSMNSSLEGISADMFLNGCKQCCAGCHNPELKEFIAPNVSISDILTPLLKNNVRILTILGGEPMDGNVTALLEVIENIRLSIPHLRVNLYTSRELRELPYEVLKVFDSIKTGGYDEQKKSSAGSFLASLNQKYWQKTPMGIFKLIYPI